MTRLVGVKRLQILLFSWAMLFALGSSLALAQDKNGEESKQKNQTGDSKSSSMDVGESTSPLTEGLLDLIGEPEASDDVSEEAKPSISPKDVGLDGEDLGEQKEDPLASVRQSMVIAAEFLNRGVTGGTTQTLQGDIVQRLDDLIQQIEDAQEDATQQSSGDQNSQTEQQETQRQENDSERQRSQTEESEESKDQTTGRDSPGNDGEKKDPRTELVDPGKLQLEVWGQLPERIRKQMQSRMVEQFLPSYRDRIQSYFESLLREDGR